jgi:hypothetical protein
MELWKDKHWRITIGLSRQFLFLYKNGEYIGVYTNIGYRSQEIVRQTLVPKYVLEKLRHYFKIRKLFL